MPRRAPLQLSAKDRFAYGEWVAKPSFEETLDTLNRPLHIPVPQRWATWYEYGWYRAALADAAAKTADYEHALLDYRQSGAALPEHAARVRSSDAGDDPVFESMGQQAAARDDMDDYERVLEQANRDRLSQARAERHEHHYHAYRTSTGSPVVHASHEELRQAGVPHYHIGERMPPPVPTAYGYQPPMGGYPQPRGFPDFASLNMGQPHRFTPAQNRVFYQANDPAALPPDAGF